MKLTAILCADDHKDIERKYSQRGENRFNFLLNHYVDLYEDELRRLPHVVVDVHLNALQISGINDFEKGECKKCILCVYRVSCRTWNSIVGGLTKHP